jgi:cytochrome c
MFPEQNCQNCHAVKDDDGNYLAGGEYSVGGPHLFDIVGRPAASVAGFEYTDAMISAREAGLVWTVESLNGFLIDPTQFLREFLGDNTVLSNMSQRLPENELRGPLLEDLVAFSPHTATSEDLATVRAVVPPSQRGEMFLEQKCYNCHVVNNPLHATGSLLYNKSTSKIMHK